MGRIRAIISPRTFGEFFHFQGGVVYKNICKNKKNLTVIDDYGHHPTEIEAVIKATKKAFPRREINLIFQPHRYTRTRDCFDEFVRVLQLPNKTFLFDIYSEQKNIIHVKKNGNKKSFISRMNNSILSLDI